MSQLDDPANRKLYTHTGSSSLLANGTNALTIANGAVTPTMLGLAAGNNATRDMLINWARGYQNGDSTQPQIQFMGDPIHGVPGIVTYGGTSASPDTVVFVPTNDGFLHAIVGQSATGPLGTGAGGQELWAFIPPELLPRLQNLAKITAAPHTYGLDGDVRVLKYDANKDGIVNGSDYVYLFFGMRMGGNHYYGLDVTDRNNPRLMWNIGPAQLPGIGQTWSPPVIAKVIVTAPANNNAQKHVLIFGGGYDINQDDAPNAYSTDNEGNRVFMVDAETGNRLWYAGNNAGANLVLSTQARR